MDPIVARRATSREDTIIGTLPDADELLAKRLAAVKKVKPLRALFSGAGLFAERVFKMEEAKVATAVRAQFKVLGYKATEGMIDEAVRQNPNYFAALTDMLQKKETWIELEAEVEHIEHQLLMRQGEVYLLGREMRLS